MDSSQRKRLMFGFQAGSHREVHSPRLIALGGGEFVQTVMGDPTVNNTNSTSPFLLPSIPRGAKCARWRCGTKCTDSLDQHIVDFISISGN